MATVRPAEADQTQIATPAKDEVAKVTSTFTTEVFNVSAGVVTSTPSKPVRGTSATAAGKSRRRK